MVCVRGKCSEGEMSRGIFDVSGVWIRAGSVGLGSVGYY